MTLFRLYLYTNVLIISPSLYIHLTCSTPTFTPIDFPHVQTHTPNLPTSQFLP